MMPKRGKISTARGHEQEKKQRNARQLIKLEFSNERISNSIEDLSFNLLLCGRCGIRKRENEFNKNKTKPHRFCRDNRCRECSKECAKKYYKKLTNEQREQRKKLNSNDYKTNCEKRKSAQRERNKIRLVNETIDQKNIRLLKRREKYKKGQNHE